MSTVTVYTRLGQVTFNPEDVPYLSGDPEAIDYLTAQDFLLSPVALTPTGPYFIPNAYSPQGLLALALLLGLESEGGREWLDVPEGATDGGNVSVAKHMGPGPHPSGSPQSVHGRTSPTSPPDLSPEDRAEDDLPVGLTPVAENEFRARLASSPLPIDKIGVNFPRGLYPVLKFQSGGLVVLGALRTTNDPVEGRQERYNAYYLNQLTALEAIYTNPRSRALWDAVDDASEGKWQLSFGPVPGVAGVHSLDSGVSRIDIEMRAFGLDSTTGKFGPLPEPRPAAGLQHTIIHEMGHALDAHTLYVKGGSHDTDPTVDPTWYYSSLAFMDSYAASGLTPPSALKSAASAAAPDLDDVYEGLREAMIWADALPAGQRKAWAYPIQASFKNGPLIAVKEFWAESVRYYTEKPALLKGLVRAINKRRQKQHVPWRKTPPPTPLDERILIDWVETALLTHLPSVPVTKFDLPEPTALRLDLIELVEEWPEGLSPEEAEWAILRSRVADIVSDSHPLSKHYGPGPHPSGGSVRQGPVEQEWSVEEAIIKHMGPGNHPSGTPQSVHGEGRLAPLEGDVERKGSPASILVSSPGVIATAQPLKDEVPLSEFDARTAPPVSLASLPEKVQRSILRKLAAYNTTPSAMMERMDWLARRAQAAYESDPSLLDLDRFYERWHQAFSTDQPFDYQGQQIGPLKFLDTRQAVGLAASISPSLDAEPNNFLYTFEIDRMLAANPVLSDDQIALINAKLEADGFAFRAAPGTRLLDFPDGQTMARAAGELRRSDRQWRLLSPEKAVNFGVGLTWDNFAKGFDVASGRLSIEDALNGIKIRSFFNNILDPLNTSGMDDLTIDFQTMDLALGMRGAMHLGDLKSGAWKGIDLGIRPVVADAIRRLTFNPDGSLTDLARSLDATSSSRMQEILWAQWKRELEIAEPPSLFGDEPSSKKLPAWIAANRAKLKGESGDQVEEMMWQDYQRMWNG